MIILGALVGWVYYGRVLAKWELDVAQGNQDNLTLPPSALWYIGGGAAIGYLLSR